MIENKCNLFTVEKKENYHKIEGITRCKTFEWLKNTLEMSSVSS